jgi:hypothetical protein
MLISLRNQRQYTVFQGTIILVLLKVFFSSRKATLERTQKASQYFENRSNER